MAITAAHADIRTDITPGRLHRLLVQTGPRGSASWRTVGRVMQAEDGLYAAFTDDRYERVWEYWQAPQTGAAPSDVVVRFAAMDGARQVHITTVRLPHWLVVEFRNDQRWERVMSLRAPDRTHGHGGPGAPRSSWGAVERNAQSRSGRRPDTH